MRLFAPTSRSRACSCAAFVLLVLSILAGCGAAPETTFDEYVEAARLGDWEKLYTMLDEESQAALDAQMIALLEAEADSAGAPPPATSNLIGPALFARLVDEHPSLHRRFDVAGYTLLESEAVGDQARLTVQLNRGGPDLEEAVIHLRREEGAWKVQLP